MRRSAYWLLISWASIASGVLAACAGDSFEAASGPSPIEKGGNGGSKASAGAAGSVGGGRGGMSGAAAGGGTSTTGKGGTGATGGSSAGPPCNTEADCNGPTANRCEGHRVCAISPSGSFCVVTGKPVDDDDHNLCTIDACDPKTGDVSHEPVPLNDDDPCTVDTCDPVLGVAHTPKGDGCDGCKTAADCNDDNPCTDDVCGANGQCVATNRGSDVVCRTEDECVGPSLCDGKGACQPGAAKSLADDDLCTTDRCVGGKIVHDRPAPNANPCIETSCDKKTGVTTTKNRADDNTKCTDDFCDPQTGNVTHTPVATLSDNEPCTKDACDPVTGEISHTTIIGCTGCTEAKDCADGSDCTVDTCTAGVCAHENLPSGQACSNGLTCDGAEICDANGKCLTGKPLIADDGDPCSIDACTEPQGVVHTAIEVDDDDPCTKDGCDKDRGVFHDKIEGCSTCTKDTDCGILSPASCRRAICEGGVCKKGNSPEGTDCSLSDATCAKCDAAGSCNVYGLPNVCLDKCGTVQTACGYATCKGCPSGLSCDEATNRCTTKQPK